MEHILNLDQKGLKSLHEEIFPSIADRETILFLGAGVSVTEEKKFLSSDIISLYETKHNLELGISDIVKFVDVLSELSWFDRNEFDAEVDGYLRRLVHNDTHKIIASIFWKEIISTNFDLLIEQAEYEIEKTSNRGVKLVPVQSAKKYHRRQANDEIRYVKLNGCMSDRSEYPFVFSSQDFARVKAFHNIVLGSLESLSPKIQFLSVGYSFSDLFAERLWKDFDRHPAFRKREIISVDPYVKDEMLAFLESKRTRVVRVTAAEFFGAYKEWKESSAGVMADRYRYKYHDKDNKEIRIDNSLRLRLGEDLRELSPDHVRQFIRPEDFYRGDRPTFAVIKQNLDVVKRDVVLKVKRALKHLLNDAESSLIVPLVFLEGSFGAGKTTFTYRLVNELRDDEDFQAVCFEAVNPSRLKAVDLAALFEKTNAQTIVLVANDLELGDLIQAVNKLRYELSVEQFKGFKVVMLGSIRENILQKFERTHPPLKNSIKISVDDPLSENEVRELLEKLRDAGLVQYRTAKELRAKIDHVIRECNGDLLLSYIDLLTDSHHELIVREAFSQLTQIAQESILKISLLHRFGILMPMTLLRSLIRKEWEEFRRDVVEYDSKNIIVKEESKHFGTEPDTYLRIKHRLIADVFITNAFPDEDRKFQEYQKLLRQVNEGPSPARMVVDLLKAIRLANDLSPLKIDRLFDEVSSKFREDPHFAVHYAMNLQRRRTKEALVKGIDVLSYAGSFSDRRNNRITHRRAVLNYELARNSFEQQREVTGETRHYIAQAEANFELKLILDPCSDFSYTNYLQFLLWRLESFELDDAELFDVQVRIEELIEQAQVMVQDDIDNLVASLRDEYFKLTSQRYAGDQNKYLQTLNTQLNMPDLRPYALILLYYHYKREGDLHHLMSIVARLEDEKHLDAVVRVLFRHYGEHLYDVNVRQKVLSLDREHSEVIRKKDSLRHHFYRYITYSYNKEFRFAWEEINLLQRLPYPTNPDLQQDWRDSNGEVRLFEAKYDAEKKQSVFLPEIQRSFPFRGMRVEDDTFMVTLKFLTSGIVARIVPS